MKIAYFDCFAGISGDMCLGALVDAGLDMPELKTALKKIRLSNYVLSSRRTSKNGISATKVEVEIKQKTKAGRQKPEVKRWADIKDIIEKSTLDRHIKDKGLTIFKKLFEAEAKVHGKSFEKVHLHELGGTDCVVDILGAVIGLDMLGIRDIYVSPINVGGGAVAAEHGTLPVPAPATAEILKGYHVYSNAEPFELTTPTGAAILSGLGAKSSFFPPMKVEKIGYGAGHKDILNLPNTLRIFIGENDTAHESDDSVVIIETNIDDMSPQSYEIIFDKLFQAGALDVFLENIIMKKGRPAVKISVISKEVDFESLTGILFRETTTIGLRFYSTRRKILERETVKVRTKYGPVRVKLARLNDRTVNISPEYDDLKTLSQKHKLPFKKVSEDVISEIKSGKLGSV